MWFYKIIHGVIALLHGSLGNIRWSHKAAITYPFMQMQTVADAQYSCANGPRSVVFSFTGALLQT